MAAFNNVTLVGRLTHDLELKTIEGTGNTVVNFTLAYNRYSKNKEAQTDFIDCVAWNKTAELLHEHFAKGNRVGIQGEITTRTYTDTNGNNRKSTEILVSSVAFVDTKGDSSNSTGNTAYAAPMSTPTPAPVVDDITPEDQELPF